VSFPHNRHLPILLAETPTFHTACIEILELDIPHEDHIKCIIWIRLVLEPECPIEDYDDVSLPNGDAVNAKRIVAV